MVTAEKTARAMLKQANELGNTLREIVRRDLADETRRFNDTLNQRIQLASEAIVQAVKAKEAIAAGASSINGKLEKAHRRYSKNNNLEEFRGVLQSTLVEVQQLREQHEAVAESLEKLKHRAVLLWKSLSDSQSNCKKQQVDGKRLVVKLMKSSQTSATQIQTSPSSNWNAISQRTGLKSSLLEKIAPRRPWMKLVDF